MRVARTRAAMRPDQLLVDAEDGHAGGVLDLEGDAVRGIDLDGVAVAQVELQLLAHELGTIAHALDLEAATVALGDAHDHVVDERARQPVELARRAFLGGSLDAQHGVLADERELRRDVALERAPGPRDDDMVLGDVDVDAGRDGDGKSTDS